MKGKTEMKSSYSSKQTFYSTVFLIAATAMAATTAETAATSPRRSGPADARAMALAAYRNGPMRFEANRGQMRVDVKFIAREHGSSYLLTEQGAILALVKSTQERQATVVRMTVVGGNRGASLAGTEELPAKTNYYPTPSKILTIPPDPGGDGLVKRSPDSAFAPITNIPNYSRVTQRNIYPGVDLVYYGANGQLEYDFIVAPGANAQQIRLRFSGARRVEVNPSGDLVLHTETGDLVQRRPRIYQADGRAKHDIDGGYLIGSNGEVAFNVAAHDARRALVIDPVVAYSTYYGSTGAESASGVAVDANGNVFLAVTTTTTDTNFNMTSKASVVKFDANGTPLFTTILGNTQCQSSVAAIAADSNGNAYITGWANPVDQNNNCVDSDETLIEKVNSSGAVVYGGIFPGYENFGNGIAIDSAGSAYITGQGGSGFPISPGAFNSTQAGPFVSKIDPSGSFIVYSTYLGGGTAGGSALIDAGNAIAVDAAGNAYITGVILGTFPFVNAFDTVPQPFLTPEAYVAVFNASGTKLLYSTLLAGRDGTGEEQGNAIALDPPSATPANTLPKIYVTGQTRSHDFPVTPGAYKTTCGSDGACDIQNICSIAPDGFYRCTKTAVDDAFVAKLDPNKSGPASLVYSTFLGGLSTDQGKGIAVDAAGNAYVTGLTASPDFPFQNPIQSFDNSNDVFVTILNPAGSALVFSTWLGGSGDDGGNGIALDSTPNLYVAGYTTSMDFLPVVNASQSSLGGGTKDAFLLKIGLP
jgi:hypothetical protein